MRRRLWSYLYFRILVRIILKFEGWRYRNAALTEPPVARSYRRGDERRIIRLFRLAFKKTKSLSRWKWEFLESPLGIHNIAVLEHRSAGIVGHLGGIVVRFNYRGRIVPAAQAVDIMIHPAFRGRLAFERLVRAFIERARENHIHLLYGFSGPHIARSYRRFFGAVCAPVSEWSCDAGRPQLTDGRSETREMKISPVEKMDTRVDQLWERIKESYPYSAVRDSAYFAWRYDRRSDRRYTFLEATDLSSGQLEGVAVLGVEASDGLILELLTDPGDSPVIDALLGSSLAHAETSGLRRVRVWLTSHGQFRGCAQSLGFAPIDAGLDFVVFRPDETPVDDRLKSEFYYSLGDYDVP